MERIKTMKITSRERMNGMKELLNELLAEDELFTSYSVRAEGVKIVTKDFRHEVFVPWFENDISDVAEMKTFLDMSIQQRMNEETLLDDGMAEGIHAFMQQCTLVPTSLNRAILGRLTYPFVTQMKNGAWTEVERAERVLNVMYEQDGDRAFLTTDFLQRHPMDRQEIWDIIQRSIKRDAHGIPDALGQERDRFLKMIDVAPENRRLSFGMTYTRTTSIHPATLLLMSSDLSIMRNTLVQKKTNRICMISFNIRNVQFFELGKSDDLVEILVAVFKEFSLRLPFTNKVPKSEDLGWNSGLVYYEMSSSGKWTERTLSREQYNFVWLGLENRLPNDRFQFILQLMRGRVQSIQGFN